MPNNSPDLNDYQIDLLYKYYHAHFNQSDDVDAENGRADRWIEGLSQEEINEILK